ncbi:MAG: cyanophycinase [Bacteroidales bacterium]
MKNLLSLPAMIVAVTLLLSSCNMLPEEVKVDTTLTRGPEKGSLVIVGGAMRDSTIALKFIELAGGLDAPMIVIPTASGADSINYQRVASVLTRYGATNVTVLHTYDSLLADTDEFVAPLKSSSGVWFEGGRQWRLVDAYGGTKTETEIRAVLDRGGVIGGSSAGATIQGSYLARGDTHTNMLIMGDHERGFGYLTNSAIDQHLLVRNRQHDLVEVIRIYPSLLGIGLDENTAIVVQGNEFEVIGQSFVAIFDYNHWDENPDCLQPLPNEGKFFLLRSGDRYNVNSREVTNWSGGQSRNIFAEQVQGE